MSKIFVIDTNKRPLDPIHPGYGRKLLKEGRAAVYRRYPFTLILKREGKNEGQGLRLKIDPGSKTTGIAIVNDATGDVVWAAELTHRGAAIKASLDRRRMARRSRRQRNTRYRKPRIDNRKRNPDWLPPSLRSRVDTIVAWVSKLVRSCPIIALSQELVRFDTQLMQNPEMAGLEYQQGTLYGYEMREYVLAKWGRKCAYCGVENVALQMEHILCKARGGSNRVSNLLPSCARCNERKGTQLLTTFLKDKPELLQRILAQAKAPLKDAAAVNTTRWALYERLKAFGVPIETGTGGRTKYNRSARHLPKTHWLDAACVGASTPEAVSAAGVFPLLITAKGRGSRQMCRMDTCGFPRTGPKQAKRVKGFQTGDMVKAIVTSGKKAGVHIGRVAIRTTGSFNITTKQGVIQGISYRYCLPIHRLDGYSYQKGEAAFPPHA